MRLHAYFRSSTSYRLRIALNLKGLDYAIEPVNIVKGEQRSPAFLSHNPFAGVPLLQADGRDRAQSLAILEWLDEAYPDNPLLPQNREDRFTARELWGEAAGPRDSRVRSVADKLRKWNATPGEGAGVGVDFLAPSRRGRAEGLARSQRPA